MTPNYKSMICPEIVKESKTIKRNVRVGGICVKMKKQKLDVYVIMKVTNKSNQ
jgi:hypothetical protein